MVGSSRTTRHSCCSPTRRGPIGDALTDLKAMPSPEAPVEVLDRSQQPSNALLQEDISGFEQMAVAFPALFLSAAALVLYVLLTRRVESRAAGHRHHAGPRHARSHTGLALPVLRAAGRRRRRTARDCRRGSDGWRRCRGLYASIIGLPEQLTVFGGFGAQTFVVGIDLRRRRHSAGCGGTRPTRGPRPLPAEAMRGEVPGAHVGRTWAERIVPGMGRASATWTMIVRGIGRNTRRTVFSATGVALALILVLVSWAMIDTMNQLISVQFDEVSTANGQVEYADRSRRTRWIRSISRRCRGWSRP